MKLNTKVIEARWDEEKGFWILTLEDQVTKGTWQDWSHVLVNGTGILNNWKWPNIEGLHDFSGPKMHSAAWDHSVDFTGKTVGVIGTGSTAGKRAHLNFNDDYSNFRGVRLQYKSCPSFKRRPRISRCSCAPALGSARHCMSQVTLIAYDKILILLLLPEV